MEQSSIKWSVTLIPLTRHFCFLAVAFAFSHPALCKNATLQHSEIKGQSAVKSSAGEVLEGKKINLHCKNLIVSISCKHSVEKEADTEGPLFCNDNLLKVSKNGITISSEYKYLDLYSPKELVNFTSPLELSCLKLDKQYVVYIGVSFGVPSCGGKCESAFLIDQNGQLSASFGTFSISEALKSSRILKIEK